VDLAGKIQGAIIEVQLATRKMLALAIIAPFIAIKS